MPQDTSGDLFGFDSNERTQHTGDISSQPYDAIGSSGFALNSVIGGTYRVLEFIGEGGMGLVYRVEHIMMNKILALKVLKTEHLTENVWRRFRLEAQAISRLDHANIIKIYDMNQTEDKRPFYTMELLSGQSLADYLQENQRLPASEALPIFRQVCSALAYAHERGIIHRDIKPGNIMLLDVANSGAPQIKIVDFGIVKLVDNAELASQGLTRQGEVFGSPLYMSPEQCAGSKLDGRADMYSVGVTLFQALCGKPPLLGRSAAETTIMHHTVTAPTLAEVAGIEFPAELEAVVAKMLAKKPDDRYKSLSDVAEVLLAIEEDHFAHRPSTPGMARAKKMTGSRTLANSASNFGAAFSTESGTGDGGQTEGGRKKEAVGLKVLLVLAAVSAVVAIVVITFFNTKMLVFRPKPQAARPLASSVKNGLSGEAETKQDAAEIAALEVSNSPEVEKTIALILAERRAPYFKTDKFGNSTFSFPSNVSIGSIGFVVPGGTKTCEAQGEFKMGRWKEMSFTANEITLEHPELLQFFPANSLDHIAFTDQKVHSDKFVSCLMKQQNLLALNMSGSPLTEAELKRIASLKKLAVLTIDTKNISHKALFQSKLLPRLEGVGLVGLTNCTPVLEELVRSKNLHFLTLTSAKLKKSDFALIAKMKGLKNLAVNCTELDDDDLKQLTCLKEICYLNVGATKITQASLPTLAKFPLLRNPGLPPELNSKYYVD